MDVENTHLTTAGSHATIAGNQKSSAARAMLGETTMERRSPVKPSALASALGVNAIVTCDCGEPFFKVGLAVNLDNGNNFIRLLECAACGRQMPATHQSDAQLAPRIGLSG